MNERSIASTPYVIAPPAVTVLPVHGTDGLFPVRRIYCVGRNYAAHAIEMGHDPDREEPFFFQKNAGDLLPPGADFSYPPHSADVHFEVELVVALGGGGRDIAMAEARDCVFGYAVGIDMTRRDLQALAKEKGRPWEAAKAFDASAPCSTIVPATRIGHPDSGSITLDVNGKRRQSGDLSQMIWKVPEIIAKLSGLFTLSPGDLIYTGTPSGVGAVMRGDAMKAQISGIGSLHVRVA